MSSSPGAPSTARIAVFIGLLRTDTFHGVRPPANNVAARSDGILPNRLLLPSNTLRPSHSPSPHPVKFRGIPPDDVSFANALSCALSRAGPPATFRGSAAMSLSPTRICKQNTRQSF